MSYVNSVSVVGRLSFEPEVRTFSTGTRKGQLRLVVEEHIEPRNKDPFTKLHFVDADVWNPELIEELANFSKDDYVLVEGSLDFQSWPDPDNAERKRSKLVVKANRVERADTENDSRSQKQNKQKKETKEAKKVERKRPVVDDDAVPF